MTTVPVARLRPLLLDYAERNGGTSAVQERLVAQGVPVRVVRAVLRDGYAAELDFYAADLVVTKTIGPWAWLGELRDVYEAAGQSPVGPGTQLALDVGAAA